MQRVPMFRDNLSIPSSGVQSGPIDYPETSVRNYHYLLCKNPEEHSSHLLWADSLAASVKIAASYLPKHSN